MPEIPDVELVIGAYLRGHDAVRNITSRVAGRVPSDTSTAWVRLTALDTGRFRGSRVEYAFHSLCQFECYAGDDGGQAEAWALGRAVRSALDDLDKGEATVALADGGFVVTAVEFSLFGRRPDPRFEPARERIMVDATIYLHL